MRYYTAPILAKASLGGANLSDANLAGIQATKAHFNDANLRGSFLPDLAHGAAPSVVADLKEADLTAADLTNASLNSANLSKADLTGAKLTGADLKWADLSGANLSEADLSEADLSGANLTGAHLTDANILLAHLAGAKSDNTTQWPKDFDLGEDSSTQNWQGVDPNGGP